MASVKNILKIYNQYILLTIQNYHDKLDFGNKYVNLYIFALKIFLLILFIDNKFAI